jgi:micrococcal nuclease
LLLAVVLAGCVPAEAPLPSPRPLLARDSPKPIRVPDLLRLEVTVKDVVDGDTLRVTGLRKGTGLVRLIGIDAPETGEGRTTRECFGPEAWRWLVEQVPRGSRVRLVFDEGERDRFGRVLAYVYRADGTFLNAALVTNGFARTMTMRPNVRHAKELQELERRARSQKRGLWAVCPEEGR